jgi:hypothetical protein
MIVVFTGLPGAGKSLKLADTVITVLYRNRSWYLKQLRLFKKGLIQKPSPRILYTNLAMSGEVEREFHGFIRYWIDLRQLVQLRDVDVVIDEIATYFDARQWENMSLEVRRWLAQHRKFGIEIYGTAQDFAQADKSFRRLTSDLLYLTKVVGSADISPTRPVPKIIWGLVLIQTLDPVRYDEEKSKFSSVGFFPRFMFISKSKTAVFDTRAEVSMSPYPPLKHIERSCELPNCQFHKTIHA